MADKRFGKPRPSGEPSGSVERKIRILLELIRNKVVNVRALCEQYETSERSLLRDFQELRKIGESAGFTLAEKVENDQIRLVQFGPPERRFFNVLLPKLRKGSHVAQVYHELEQAWLASERVTFTHANRMRTVEPAASVVRSNRYYLLARDAQTREWKFFALDEIGLPITRSGTFAPQPVPEPFLTNDAIGFLRAEGKGEHRVSVRLSPAVATSALSREWQHVQEIQHNGDGSATITFTVSDIGEVVRWALSFGAEAQVVGPGHAIELARSIAEQIWRAYE